MSRRSPRQWPLVLQKNTNVEQVVSSLAARVAALETISASASSGSVSASSWNLLGQTDGSTATGSLLSHGPGSSDDNRNTRRRLDTFSSPGDEHARSAVLLHFPCEQIHAGVSTWLEKFSATANALSFNKPTRLIAKQVPYPPGLCLKHELSVKTLWHDTKMMVPLTKLTVHFCNIRTKIMVRQSNSLEDGEIGRRFAPLWKNLSAKLQEIFPERDVKGTFIVPALDVRSHILSIFDRRNGVGKLAPPGHEHLFDLPAPDLCEPSISDDVLRQVLC